LSISFSNAFVFNSYAELYDYGGHANYVRRAEIVDNEVEMKECYVKTTDNNGLIGSSCTGVQGSIVFDHHVPESLALSGKTGGSGNINTLVVGYPDYKLATPSTTPSETPSVSLQPSSHPSSHPSQSPSDSIRRRLTASEPDQYGIVGIYEYAPETSHTWNGVYNGWDSNPQYLECTNPDADFGTGVAISEDGMTVAVGSPGINTVQVFRLLEGSWDQIGDDIVNDGNDNTRKFGYRVGLSSDGNALAVAAPNDNDSYTNAGAVHAYDLDLSDNTWTEGISVAYGTSSNQNLGIKGVAIDPIAKFLHAVDTSSRISFEVCLVLFKATQIIFNT